MQRGDGPTEPARTAWKAAFDASVQRDVPFETMSGVPVEPVYGDAPFPGQFPYTRGLYASMFRSRLWTMRMFAGFGTAHDTNDRFKELLRSGGTGLSTAFDMPTLMGRDSDNEWAVGEVGRAGVAIDTLDDMCDLFADIDLSAVSTSMTVNGPAAILLAMYVAVGEAQGTERRQLSGTLQNDIFKEYQAQKEYIFPPRPSVRLVTDVIRFTSAEMPRWHPVSISGYHIREAGSTAAQELAFTLANGFAYVEAAIAAGLDVDDFSPRLSFFFNSHIDFFEEIGKFRAARRIWARWMHDRYGARDERSLMCRFHTQTAGVSLTAQQPEINIARVAIQALAAVIGGTQSLHTDSYDEALALPTEKAARIALRTQQIIAHESGVPHVADPLGGSQYVEWMTDEMERQAEEVFSRLAELGRGSMLEGVYEGIENGYFVGEIADASYRFEKDVNNGRRIVVGSNAFTEDDNRAQSILRIGPETENVQLHRLNEVKRTRDGARVADALHQVTSDAREPTTNLMPALIDAVKARATEGEIVAALEQVFGTYRSPRRCDRPGAGKVTDDAPRLRVLLAKLGLDGHDRGLKVVARILRDAGMEVVYLGLRQTADSIVAAAEQEDVDVVGLSMHNAGHLTLAPRMVRALREAGLDVPVVVGGIIPDDDAEQLRQAGVAGILGPGASASDVAATVRAAATSRAAALMPEPISDDATPAELLARARDGNRVAVGRLLTLVERGGGPADAVDAAAVKAPGTAHVVGITGPPGAGKSTLIDQLTTHAAATGARPAVLAIDPSSPLTGGAILGDRVRMGSAARSDVFIRSMASRGHVGGLALATPAAARVLGAVGFDPVLIETVGAGQLEVEVAEAADTTVVVVAPGWGDSIQANKAGLLEVADVLVVNKADRPGADDARRDLELMVALAEVTGGAEHSRPPILLTAATEGTGISELWEAIRGHHQTLAESGRLVERRAARTRAEIRTHLEHRLRSTAEELLEGPEGAAIATAAVHGEITPDAAARLLLSHAQPAG